MNEKTELGDEIELEPCELAKAHEKFEEPGEVLKLIDDLPNFCSSDKDINKEEASFERFQYIFNKYKDQPHLMDPYLDEILKRLLSHVQRVDSSLELKHKAFKYMYIVINLRGYKTIVCHLPHEISDLEPTLKLLEAQNPSDTTSWETRYCLLIWLTVIIMMPFHMSCLDSRSETKSCKDRFMDLCTTYVMSGDASHTAAAFLLSRFLARDDVKEQYLPSFVDWFINKINEENPESKLWDHFGPMVALAAVLKHGQREDLVPYSSLLLKTILNVKRKKDSFPLEAKVTSKIISRIGLTLLKPRIVSWSHNRDNRSLAVNLANVRNLNVKLEINVKHELNIDMAVRFSNLPTVGGPVDSEENELPEEIEIVIDELINSLKNKNLVARWSAAKGIGRIVARLPQDYGDQVVPFVLDIFDPHSSHSSWNGGCLALAELAKRGVLLPERLPLVVPVIMQSLVFEKPLGNASVGANVRDAACYLCWCLARAYPPSIIEPYVVELARGLLTVACFDREINCRRAAAAAFQENVGRLGNFPHGLEIIAVVDYYAVSGRTNSFLKVSAFIAQYEEYSTALINHLLNYKLDTWDSAVRNLAAKALFNLTPYAPDYVTEECLKKLISMAKSPDLLARHGSVTALGEVIYALSLLNKEIDAADLAEVEGLTACLAERGQLIGVSGKLVKLACCSFILNCCKAKLPFHQKPVINVWQEFIDSCFSCEMAEMREKAAMALTQLCQQYYIVDSEDILKIRNDVVHRYIVKLRGPRMTVKIGGAVALGALPAFMLRTFLREVVDALIVNSRISDESTQLAFSRAASLKALTSVCLTVGLGKTNDTVSCYNLLEDITEALLNGFKDYTTDSQGDVGAWVREAAIIGLKDVILQAAEEASELLGPDLVRRIFTEVAQQAVEGMDRIRGVAGKTFSVLLYKEGKSVPHIPEEDKVRAIFSPHVCSSINWISGHQTFPLFIQLLSLPEFTRSIFLGLCSSVGGLTLSLVKQSSDSLVSYISAQTDEEKLRMCDVLVSLYKEYHLKDVRIIIPLIRVLEQLFGSQCLSSVITNPDNKFAYELYQLTKVEMVKNPSVKKLYVCLDLFIQLLQVSGEVCKKSLSQLCLLLNHKYSWLRRDTSVKMIEALMLYSEDLGVESEDLDKTVTLLSETKWEQDREITKEIRNEICLLLKLPLPKTRALNTSEAT